MAKALKTLKVKVTDMTKRRTRTLGSSKQRSEAALVELMDMSPTYKWGSMCGNRGGVDNYGNPVERSKIEYPYSYSPFVTWRQHGFMGPGEHAVYSDRLITWDFDKHDRLCQKHFGNKGQMWTNRAATDIEAFLRDYFDKPDLELQIIMEGCNVSNGYPYWTFHYR